MTIVTRPKLTFKEYLAYDDDTNIRYELVDGELIAVIRCPPICRRQLHLMVPAKGGIRRKYGGTTTRHGFRKGDYVKAEMAGRVVYGWVSGDTKRQVSVSNADWSA